jgi:hypothetical protein
MEGTRRRREFEEALRNAVAKLGREGKDRIDRSYIEDIGQRYDLEPDEAREFFMKSRGEIWQGELIECEGEPSWEAATLKNVPSTGISPEDSSV